MSQRYIGGLIYNPPGGFSGYFDGSGDYLDAGAQTAFSFGTGAWTIEAWVFVTTLQEILLFDTRSSASTAGVGARIDANGTLFYSGSANNSLTTNAIAANTWTHVAWVYDGTTLSGYINGVRGGTATPGFNITQNNGVIGRVGFAASGYMAGYISNLRVVKGTAVYSGASFDPPNGPLQAITNTSLLTCAYPTFRDGSTNNFTITVNGNTAVSTQNPFPQTQLPNPALGNQGNGVYSMSQYQALRSQNLWPSIDQYWPYVTMMLHGNGTNGAQNNTFLDSSTNNFTITRNGNTTQGTFTPYGSNWSNFFNGSNQYLSIANNANLTVGASFTFECWFFATAASDGWLFGKWVAGGQEYALAVTSSNGFNFYFAPVSLGGAAISTANNVFALNTWNHVAVARTGGVITLYVNGVSAGTVSNSTAGTNGNTPLYVGVYGTGGPSNYFPGYISNLRINTTTAVYTAAFTPPTSPLTAVSGTQFLTCQSNRFIDNSSNAFSITASGDVSVQRFSPFNPTTPYAAGTIGGSGYFDGSGDYLSATTAASLGSGDFTVECWVYFTSAPGADTGNIICSYNYYTAGFNGNVVFRLGTSYGCRIFNGQTLVAEISGTFTWPLYTWTHVAWVRSGSTITLYKNGVSIGSMTASTNLSDFANGFVVGASRINGTVGEYSTCYISNLRMVAGTAVYTTTFTPPTAPLTAITNTQLLLNMTNGGIIDNAMMNDLETVGNAQISTSVSKFGGGSLAFDGSGDYLIFPANSTFQFGTGDFTIEFWTYLNSVSGFQMFIDNRNSTASTGAYITIYADGSTLFFYTTGNDRITATSALSTGTWLHIAVARSGTSTKMFLNGTQVGSTYTDSNSYLAASTNQYIGARVSSNDFNLNGYIDDLRITKGYARYTANFTPQRSQWQDQ